MAGTQWVAVQNDGEVATHDHRTPQPNQPTQLNWQPGNDGGNSAGEIPIAVTGAPGQPGNAPAGFHWVGEQSNGGDGLPGHWERNPAGQSDGSDTSPVANSGGCDTPPSQVADNGDSNRGGDWGRNNDQDHWGRHHHHHGQEHGHHPVRDRDDRLADNGDRAEHHRRDERWS